MARFMRSYGKVIIRTKVGRHYAPSLSDSLTTTESISKAIVLRSLTETALTASETLTTIIVRLLGFTTEVVTVSDSILRAITKAPLDALTTSEAFSKIQSYFRSLSDSLTAASSMTTAKGKTLSDSLTVIERFMIYLNGFTTLWTRVAKSAAGTWNKTAKTIGEWRRG